MQFWVAGRPYAQSRPRSVIKGGKSFTYSNASKGLKNWKARIGDVLSAAINDLDLQPLDGALCVDMVFYISVKAEHHHWQLAYGTPDKDNLEKAVLDVMEDAGLFTLGDSQVAVGEIIKLWCPPGSAGVFVQVKRARLSEVKKTPARGCEGEEVPEWLANPSAV